MLLLCKGKSLIRGRNESGFRFHPDEGMIKKQSPAIPDGKESRFRIGMERQRSAIRCLVLIHVQEAMEVPDDQRGANTQRGAFQKGAAGK